MEKIFVLTCHSTVSGSGIPFSENEKVICASRDVKKLHSYMKTLNDASRLLDRLSADVTIVSNVYSIKIAKFL